jgi:hypothetical protein
MFIVFVQICFTLVHEKVIADFMVQSWQYLPTAVDFICYGQTGIDTFTQLDRNKKTESGDEKYQHNFELEEIYKESDDLRILTQRLDGKLEVDNKEQEQ